MTDTPKQVTGPYRDPRHRTRPWAVTVQAGQVTWTLRFNQQDDAIAYAKKAPHHTTKGTP